MEWQALIGLGGVPVIVALVGLCRGAGLSTSWAPLAAVVLGVLWNLALAPLGAAVGVATSADVYALGLQGVLAGLAAGGLYDAGKAGLKALLAE